MIVLGLTVSQAAAVLEALEEWSGITDGSEEIDMVMDTIREKLEE